MTRKALLLAIALSLTVAPWISGCAGDAEPQKVASANGQTAPSPAPQPAARPSDIQSLQQDRKQDAQVISDAQKAVGALGH